MIKDIFNLDDPEIKGLSVEIQEINLDEDIKFKLEQINFYQGEIIQIIDDKDKNMIQFTINNAKYAIRARDAKNIIVKKVN